VGQLEETQPCNLESDAQWLSGVWELRWSSAKQPWLKQSPWLENLQLLDLSHGRGMNLLRLRGPFGALAAISVVADLEVEDGRRVKVNFRRGGWIGPQLGAWRPELLAQVKQKFPAWLDMTVLDEELRICRGNAGTVFALIRRRDLAMDTLFPSLSEGPAGEG